MRLLAVVLAAVGVFGLGALLTGCGGSEDPRPDLVLVSTRDGDYAIYAMNVDGGSQQRLSENDGDTSTARGIFFQLDPAWSSDSRRIAFSSRRSGTFDIYAMRPDGSGIQRLTETRQHDVHPTWSPDGSRLAFARSNPDRIYVMNADGTGLRRLGADDAGESEPAWSPDGRWLAYVRRTPGTQVRELWLARPDGSVRRRLTRLGEVASTPAWSPDSRRVAFASNVRHVQFDLYAIGVDGKGLERLTVTPEDTFEPAWSPDGRTLAFAEGGAIFTLALGGDEEPRRVTDPDNNDSSPVWNPRPPPPTNE